MDIYILIMIRNFLDSLYKDRLKDTENFIKKEKLNVKEYGSMENLSNKINYKNNAIIMMIKNIIGKPYRNCLLFMIKKILLVVYIHQESQINQ